MKNKNIIVVLVLSFVFFLFSCSTTVPVSYMEPSIVNMGAYRNVALSSVVKGKVQNAIPFYIRYDLSDPTIRTYAFLTSYSENDVETEAANAGGKVMKKVFENNQYYNTLSPASTDVILKSGNILGRNSSEELRSAGYDAVIIPRIERLNTDEYIGVRKRVDGSSGKEENIYTIYRSVSLTLSVNVVDTETNQIVVTKSYSDSEMTEYVFNPEDVVFISYIGDTHKDLINDCMSNILPSVMKDFVPQTRVTDITLMSNKPKLESVEDAYKYAKNGNLTKALEMFLSSYSSEGHIPSGYNAAIILASQHKLENAITLLEDLSNNTTNKDVYNFLSKLKQMKKRDDEARKQMQNATKPSNANNVYDMLLNSN